MIAYCPLEELNPPVKQQKPVVELEIEEDKPTIGREETELNYVVMAFIVGVFLSTAGFSLVVNLICVLETRTTQVYITTRTTVQVWCSETFVCNRF